MNTRTQIGFLALALLCGCHDDAVVETFPVKSPPYTSAEIAEQRRQRVCALHHEALREDTVPVVYGSPSKDFLDAKESQFPFSETSVCAGCIEIEPSEPKREKVWYCPECRRAQAAWRVANGY